MKKLFAILLAITLAFSLAACGRKSAVMKVDNGDDGIITVTAKNSEKDSSGVGYITIDAGECLVISPVLEKGAFRVAVRDKKEKTVLDKTVDGKVMSAWSLDPGDYSLLITCKKTAVGTMKIIPYSVDRLNEENAKLAEALEESGVVLK